MLTAVCRKLQQQQVLQAVRFWRMFTACSICERLQLQQPAYPYSCEAFDAWLWHHEQQRRLQQQAEGLSVRLGVLRYFGEGPDLHVLTQSFPQPADGVAVSL